MKKILLAGIIIFIGFAAKSQSMGYEYKTALGVKFYPGGISLKSFIQTNKAIEGLGYFYTDGVRFTGGVIGLDYKFKDAPINVSLDWQPSFNFVGYNYFEGGWGGLGIRYTF